jgi:hypothetical protein
MEPEKPIQITGTTPTQVWLPEGRPEQGYQVNFTTPSGVHTHVHVPRSENFVDAVRDAVQQESDRVEAAVKTFPKPA